MKSVRKSFMSIDIRTKKTCVLYLYDSTQFGDKSDFSELSIASVRSRWKLIGPNGCVYSWTTPKAKFHGTRSETMDERAAPTPKQLSKSGVEISKRQRCASVYAQMAASTPELLRRWLSNGCVDSRMAAPKAERWRQRRIGLILPNDYVW